MLNRPKRDFMDDDNMQGRDSASAERYLAAKRKQERGDLSITCQFQDCEHIMDRLAFILAFLGRLPHRIRLEQVGKKTLPT